MAVQLERKKNTLVAYLSGEIDHHTAQGIREVIDFSAEEVPPERLVLDFREITFMDSSGIGLVMGRYQLMKSLGGTLQLENVPTPIGRVMKLAGLDKLTGTGEQKEKGVTA